MLWLVFDEVARDDVSDKNLFRFDNNFHYGQRIKRRATYLLRTFIHIKLLKFSFGLSAQPRAIEFLWQKVWVNLAEEFFGEISKPLTSKDLAFVTIRYAVSTKCRLQTRYKMQTADCRLSTKCRLTRKNFFLRQKRVNMRFYNFVLFTHAKTFHRVFMALIDRDRITSRLNYDNKLFCTTLFWCSLKRTSVKLTKLLVRCLNASWKSFYVNLHVAFERLAFVASHRSHAVTPRWLDDDKECIQSVWSKQRDCCS